jgi:DNA-binding IclR family transcriptional regulator
MLNPAEQRLESVDLVLAMLELLAASDGPRALGDIARSLLISKPRAHRHLRALILNGYVHQDIDDRYWLGARLIQLAESARSKLNLAVAARPTMAALRDATGESVTASSLIGGAVTIVELFNGTTIVQFAIRPGTVLPSTNSAHGLVTLAFGKGDAGGEPVDPAMLEQIRQRGWAVAPGLTMTGVNALAAPVFDHSGEVVGAIALVGSIDNIPAEPPAELIAKVCAAAREVSERMGWKDAR